MELGKRIKFNMNMNKKIMLVLAALLTTFASLSAKTALIIVAHGIA